MDLYNKVVEYVDTSFKGKKPHFERTVYWIEQLLPNSTEAHKISAYAHDIERGVKGEKDRDYLNPDILKRHSEEGSEIMAEFLQKNGAEIETINKVKHLISKHETGGDAEQNALMDADSISYFETNAQHFVEERLKTDGYKKVKDKLDWMFNRISSEEHKKFARENYEKWSKELEKISSMESNKHIIIFSHGFGGRKDGRGLLANIAEELSETQSVLFDYNEVNETTNTIITRLLSLQAKMLDEVVRKVRIENPEAIVDVIAHSQGCLAMGIAKPDGVRKTIFIAPPLDNDIKRFINIFRERPGTEINLSGISKLVRRDGTTTIFPAEFWEEFKQFKPAPLYNKLASQTELIIINANKDEVLGKTNTNDLDKKIEIINMDGNHQFSGEAREFLLEKIKTIIF